jgi:hypothetical protein
MSAPRQSLVYLIQCHHSARYLADMFACLHTPADFFIINVDGKSPTGLKTLAATLGADYPNVHILPMGLISWGGFAQAEIVLRAIDALPAFGDAWSHLVVLSEQHLPLASPEEIAVRLVPGQSMMPYNRFADLSPPGRVDVLHRFSMEFQELPGVGSMVKARYGIDESFYEQLYHSNNWFVLARNACDRLRGRDEDAALLRRFVSSIQPDEMLVPTMLLGYPRHHRLNVVRRNASFIAAPHLGGAPGLIFTELNFHTAVEQRYLFIRKRPDDLPPSVQDYLGRHTGMNDPRYRELRETAIQLDAAPPGQRYRDDMIAHFAAFAAGHPEIEATDFCRRDFRNIPALFVLFKSRSWHKDVRVALLSEDFRHFKILLVWNDVFKNSFDRKTIETYEAVVIKTRVHGLALAREIFIEDEPNGGFVDIESASALPDVDQALIRHFAAAEIFSQSLLRHEARELAGASS